MCDLLRFNSLTYAFRVLADSFRRRCPILKEAHAVAFVQWWDRNLSGRPLARSRSLSAVRDSLRLLLGVLWCREWFRAWSGCICGSTLGIKAEYDWIRYLHLLQVGATASAI